ncbi:MFS transporter [Streptomyces radicis]|uniref:MFS transporter n=1 Tax=Streptomyces radicis TaxID=1750517 RepID=A0A3A9VVF3_9ACTN|nr:MFS transporter [Streptomyces radicis]RKN15490.1 MFS transporter [Streptomyces radicis]
MARPSPLPKATDVLTSRDPGAGAQGAAAAPTSLWRHRDFLLYWFGQTVSRGGTQVAELVLPLAAIYLFEASAGQLGVINAIAFAPYLLVTLLAGVWIDRSTKRGILAVAELGRIVALGAVAALTLVDGLELYHLYLVAAVMGVCAVLFDVSGTAYLPSLIERDQLLDGNSRLQGSIVVTQAGGPALGGVLVSLASAPAVLAASVISPIASLAALFGIRHKERPPERPERRDTFAEIGESLRFIARDRYLRFLVVRSGVNNLFFMARTTILPLFVLDVLGMSSALLGLVLAAGAVGALTGATLAKRMALRLGPGRVIAFGYGGASLAQIILPLTMGPTPLALAMLLTMFFVSGTLMTIGNTNVATFQQMVIPRRKIGRVVAGMRTVTWGAMPLGALLGGWLGSVIGIRETLFVTATGFCLSALWIALSPIAKLRTMPEPPEED